MGTRYILTVICPICKTEDSDVYYAPTCNFTTHTCSSCKHIVDLEKYTGISYEDASNATEIGAIVDSFLEERW
ncbi:hypothetical protein LCGC14_1133020 [marine sediment metagenome]|uniref:Uncharacterized protein n=1 Tax=marine sediment metagenome TaxID=412755 RepID=A0A0F9M5H0_9ZZZZ